MGFLKKKKKKKKKKMLQTSGGLHLRTNANVKKCFLTFYDKWDGFMVQTEILFADRQNPDAFAKFINEVFKKDVLPGGYSLPYSGHPMLTTDEGHTILMYNYKGEISDDGWEPIKHALSEKKNVEVRFSKLKVNK